jgi:hypothetical protein
MYLLADEHTTVFAPGTLPKQKDYLFFVTTATYVNTMSNGNKHTSGVVVLSSSGPDKDGKWTLDFASDYGYSTKVGDGTPSGDGSLCDTHGQVFRTPIVRGTCPTFPAGGTEDSTFDLDYVGAGSVVIDPTNIGPRELLAIYNANNTCIGLDQMHGYYTTTGVATSEQYGKFWPIYRTGFELYPNETPSAPNAPEGAFDDDVCRSCLEETCTPPNHGNYGRYPILTPSYTIEQAVASGNKLQNTIGSQEPSAFVDDVHASRNIFLYTMQNSVCAHTYCPLSHLVYGGTISISRARLNGGTGPLKFTRWYGPPELVSYDNYVSGTVNASFDLQTEYYLNTPFTNAGTGHDGGGLESPIFPMDPNRSPKGYLTCQAGGTGDEHDQRQTMGSISYVPATGQYLLTFLCTSPSAPALGQPKSFDDTQRGAAIFYSTLDADLYDLSNQDRWSPPQEVPSSWEPFKPDTQVCKHDLKQCRRDSDCSTIVDSKGGSVDNSCGWPTPTDCLKSGEDWGDLGCGLDRYTGWYPSFMSMGIKGDGTNPANYNPSYLSTTGYIFAMEGCLGPNCTTHRVYNSRQFWIDIK